MFEEIYKWFTQFCCTTNTESALEKITRVLIEDGKEDILAGCGFTTLGIWTLVVSFLLCFAFYIWPLDHPRFKAWWAWLTTAGVNALLAFLIGLIYGKVRLGYFNGDDKFLYHIIHNGSEEEEYYDGLVDFHFNFGDYLSIGLANIFVALLFFIFFSLCLNWFGKSTKYSPFRK